MKKIIKLLFIFTMFLFIKDVYASSNNYINLNSLKNIDNVFLSEKYGKYDSAQGMTITNKYIAIFLASTDSSVKKNMVFLYDKNNYKLVSKKEVESCSHANGVTYNSDENVVVCADASNKRFVVYNANDFSVKKIVNTGQPYNNIAYDSDRKNYWIVNFSTFGREWYKIVRFNNKFERESDISYNSLDSYNFGDGLKYFVNQDIVYKNQYLYLINYVNKDNIDYFKKAFANVKENDTIILSYDVRTGKKGNLIYYHPSQWTNEIEDVAFDGEKVYFLYQRNGLFRLYTSGYTPRNVNAKLNVVVDTNNSSVLKTLGLNANFVSTSNNFSLNKKVSYKDGGYTLSNIQLNKPGKYNLKITQDNKIYSNWSIDQSVLNATINVKYSLNSNNLYYTVSYKDKNNKFNNKITYDKINVPINISAPLANSSGSSYMHSYHASLYKDNNKISSVVLINGKYSFNNLSFITPGEYNYEIRQDNSGTIKDGIYSLYVDNSVIKFKIKVTVSGSKLVYKVIFDGKSSFYNSLSVKYNTVNNNIVVPIVTNKSNSSINTPNTKLKIYKGEKLINTVNNSGSNYSFNIDISSPGVYRYKLLQDTSITSNGIYKYSLDNNEMYLDIDAKVVGNRLVCSYKLSRNKFINDVNAEYEAINVPIKIKINSTISGNINMPETKAVINGNGLNTELVSTDGYYNYNIPLSKEGQYKYTIKQKNYSNSNYESIIDSNLIVVTINVSISGDRLIYDINYSNQSFNNIYKAYNPINIDFSTFINTSRNDSSINVSTTSANLYDSSDRLINTVNSNNNKYVFSNISFSESGEYVYKIVQKQENINLGSNIIYNIDDKIITVTVTITNNGSGYNAKVSYSSNEFNNSITNNYLSINVNPVFNIENSIDTGIDDIGILSASIYSSDGKTKIATVSSNDSLYSFSITIDSPGEYEYIVKQDNSGYKKNGNNNIYIDSSIKKVFISVITENGVLKPTIKYNLNNNTFSNSFVKIENILNIPLSLNIKNNTSSDNIIIPKTTATLRKINSEGESEIIEKVENTNDKYIFNNIDINTDGTYIYIISQEHNISNDNIQYDYQISDDEKTIVISSFKNQNGDLTYRIDGDDSPFENSYSIIFEPINISLSANILNNNITSNISIFNKLLVSDDNQVFDMLDINSSNNTFNNIIVNKEGEYIYKIYQSMPNNYSLNGINYSIDSSIVTARVNVYADTNDKLNYSVTYDGEQGIKTFTNNFTNLSNDETNVGNIPINVDIISNSSELYNIKFKATLFKDNLPLETVENNNNNYNFNNLYLIVPGNYSFTIKQVPVDDDNWIIDDAVIQLDINTYYDENGNFQYDIHYVDDISSFSNFDININNDDDNLSVVSEETSYLVANVPSTSLSRHYYFVIIGSLLIIVGFYIVRYYKKNYR